MKIIRNVKELRDFRRTLNGSVGFVPTMGALHDGHLSLIRLSVSQNENTVVSIFVNPTQFLPGEDLNAYPRKEEADLKLCEMAGVTAVFCPNAAEFYAPDEPKVVAAKPLSERLEGATRPGHFDGVCQVLNKLFNLVRPARAYFGKKDAQQVAVVQNMVERFYLDVEVVPCELVRESSGLALSSRNAYLSEAEKNEALALSHALFEAANLIKKGELESGVLKAKMREVLGGLKVDYTEVVNRKFEPLSSVELGNTIILLAVYVGKTRLIDNIWL